MTCSDENGFWFPAEFKNSQIKQAADNEYYSTESNKLFNETECIFGDGKKQAVIAINGKSPPPPLEVQQGAMLHITVIQLFDSNLYFS